MNKKEQTNSSAKIKFGPFSGEFAGISEKLIERLFNKMMYYKYARLIAGIILAVCGVKYLLVYASISLPELVNGMLRWIKAKPS